MSIIRGRSNNVARPISFANGSTQRATPREATCKADAGVEGIFANVRREFSLWR
jgi:hypothetical protein